MTVFVIAQDGQIRDALEKQLTIRNRACLSAGPEWFEACDKDAVAKALLIPRDISVVVNALSLECLSLPDDSLGSHLCKQQEQLAAACARQGIPLIHLSGSRVFDGLDGGVHREAEPADPASQAGQYLARMEQLISQACGESIILRVGPIFSSVGDNLLTALLQQFRQPAVLPLSNQGESCPIHASDMARVVSAIIDQLSCGAEVWGIYHYCSADYVSHFEFAEAVMAVVKQHESSAGCDATLEAAEIADDSWSWPLLNCEKLLNTFGIKQLPWRAFIAPTVKKYLHPELGQDEPVLTQSIQTVQKENFDG